MTLAEKIRTHRASKGLTQEELAAKTKVTSRTIQRIENGEVIPRLYTLHAMAAALEVNAEDLIRLRPSAENNTQEHIWLPLVHVSAYFLFIIPTTVIWLIKGKEIEEISVHARDVINFQITLLLAMGLCMLLAPVLFIALVFYHLAIVVINTVKVIRNQPYRYPLTIPFLRS